MRDDAPSVTSDHPTDLAVSDAAELVTVCRSITLARPAYRFYRALLLTFAARGAATDAAELRRLADEYGVPLEATLDEFAAQDLAQRDPATGAIRAAYPFSGVPTAHRVQLAADGPDRPAVAVYAMCAIDALGIPLMLKRAAVVSSFDALTGEPVRVEVVPSADSWTSHWEPDRAVVFARPEEHLHEHGVAAAHTCCPIINFFASRANAQLWAGDHAPTDGHIYDQEEALRYAAARFAGVLDRLDDQARA
jgi:hypothetical protein